MNQHQNPSIGKNLYLHPFGVMNAVFEKDVRGWEGKYPTIKEIMTH